MKDLHKSMKINDVVNETIEQFPSIKLKCNLAEVLEYRGMTLRELSLLTGIRYASLNELKNGKRVTLNLQHVMAVVVALRITDFGSLFEIDFGEEEEKQRFISESHEYDENGVPDSEFSRLKENAVRLDRTNELKKHQR